MIFMPLGGHQTNRSFAPLLGDDHYRLVQKKSFPDFESLERSVPVPPNTDAFYQVQDVIFYCCTCAVACLT